MSGSEEAHYVTLAITYPHFIFHDDYAAYNPAQLLGADDVEWVIFCNFNIEAHDENHSRLIVTIGFTMNRKNDALKIAELTTQSVFSVGHHLSFEMKYFILCRLIDQTVGHAEGGWRMKNKNVCISSLLPPVFGEVLENDLLLKKRLYEEWE